MDNNETRIEVLEAEVRYQSSVVANSQPGSLTSVIAGIRLEAAKDEHDRLKLAREIEARKAAIR